jgi:hypothetical protein
MRATPAGSGVAERGNPCLFNMSRPLVDLEPRCLAMLGLMLVLSPPTHMRARAIKHLVPKPTRVLAGLSIMS